MLFKSTEGSHYEKLKKPNFHRTAEIVQSHLLIPGVCPFTESQSSSSFSTTAPLLLTISLDLILTYLQMATIQSVKARQIFDSRGNPTVEVIISIPLYFLLLLSLHHRRSVLYTVISYLHLKIILYPIIGWILRHRSLGFN